MCVRERVRALNHRGSCRCFDDRESLCCRSCARLRTNRTANRVRCRLALIPWCWYLIIQLYRARVGCVRRANTREKRMNFGSNAENVYAFLPIVYCEIRVRSAKYYLFLYDNFMVNAVDRTIVSHHKPPSLAASSASWYVTNDALLKDLNIRIVDQPTHQWVLVCCVRSTALVRSTCDPPITIQVSFVKLLTIKKTMLTP